jgi:acyl carrier protein
VSAPKAFHNDQSVAEERQASAFNVVEEMPLRPRPKGVHCSTSIGRGGRMALRTRAISRRGAIVALLGSAIAAGSAGVASQKKSSPKKKTIDPKVPERVHDIIVMQLGVDDEEVRYDSRFVADLGADSLDMVELVQAFEEEFEIEIPDRDAENITRVGELVEYLRKRKALG